MRTRRRRPLYTLVLAAGLGKRMRSRRIKLLHEVSGRPMLSWVVDAVRGVPARRNFIVLGHQAERVRELVPGGSFRVLIQREQRGTGHAVMQAQRPLRSAAGDLLILSGDIPAIRTATLRSFVETHVKNGAAATVLTTQLDNPSGYGRILRDTFGEFTGIVEDRDATTEERRIREVSTGIYCCDVPLLFRALRETRPDNTQGEFYLPDVLGILRREGKRILAIRHEEAWEVLGVNSRSELARLGRLLNRRIVDGWMERGVTILDPDRTFIGPEVRIGRDTTLYPSVHLEGKTTIGEDCVVHPGCFLTDARIDGGAMLLSSCVVTDSRVGADARIGPFAHLRPGTVLGPDVRIGNFVELKQARVGAGTKANHLSYLGDVEIGEHCNIGAGTITCNYDGVAKHKTVLESDVFVGSDSQLVAPVRVRRGAYIGSGSTIVSDVPPGALALARSRQTNVEGWVARKKREREAEARKSAGRKGTRVRGRRKGSRGRPRPPKAGSARPRAVAARGTGGEPGSRSSVRAKGRNATITLPRARGLRRPRTAPALVRTKPRRPARRKGPSTSLRRSVARVARRGVERPSGARPRR